MPNVYPKKPSGMKLSALLRLAWRESRTARRRLALYMSSIALGVAALVAIDSFAGNVKKSIREQSRTLLGGDLQVSSRSAFSPEAESLLDSLANTGIENSRLTSFASMALSEKTGNTRLAQIRAVSESYPFYGSVETSPENAWQHAHDSAPLAYVDPSLLVSLDSHIGDTIRIGNQIFSIAASIESVPGDAGITAVLGPRVYISSRWLEATGLLQFGARAEYESILRLKTGNDSPREGEDLARELRRRLDPLNPARIAEQSSRERASASLGGGERLDDDPTEEDALTAARVRVRTVADTERDFTESVGRLADFLSLIGLIALLLGGVGVASGINAFVVSRIDTVAILRCLGASSRQILSLYLLQAGVMGFVGALMGTLIGVAIQFSLPGAVSELLPFNVSPILESQAIAFGLITGLWVAIIFALRPLLALRHISPLQALRRSSDADAARSEWKDIARTTVDILLVASVTAISIARTETLQEGLLTASGIAAAVLILWAAATALIRLARGIVRPSWPFTLRQGIANLYRPSNQTRSVTLALGFGSFLLSTIYLVQGNLLHRFEIADSAATGNLLFFDVQQQQLQTVESIISQQDSATKIVEKAPIITMRLAGINGRSVSSIISDSNDARPGWALRREYRSTWKDELSSSETVTRGRWTSDSAERERKRGADGPYELSLEEDLAKDLAVGIGDTLTWNVQGVSVSTVISSLRSVNWARFETNFFAVFPPEALVNAPQQFVVIAQVPEATTLASIQRDVVRLYPNVSSIDLSLIRNTVASIVDRVTMAIRFLGVFCLAIGVPVLFSAVAATRRARLREGVLLRTLGASKGLVQRVLFFEYAALGFIGSVTGMALAFCGTWVLMRWVFAEPFQPSWGAAVGITLAMVALAVSIGLLTSRDIHRETPMAVLRDI